LELLRTHRDVDLVFADAVVLAAGVPQPGSEFGQRDARQPIPRVALGDHRFLIETPFDHLLVQPFIIRSAVVMRRTLVAQVGLFDEELPTSEDWEYWIRLAFQRKFGFIDLPLVRRHEQGDNISLDLKLELEIGPVVWSKIASIRGVTPAQRQYIRQRWARALFNLGHYRYWKTGDRWSGRRLFWRSLWCRPTWPAAKCAAYSLIPWFHRLKRASHGSTRVGT
jgi:hypothetical protein